MLAWITQKYKIYHLSYNFIKIGWTVKAQNIFSKIYSNKTHFSLVWFFTFSFFPFTIFVYFFLVYLVFIWVDGNGCQHPKCQNVDTNWIKLLSFFLPQEFSHNNLHIPDINVFLSFPALLPYSYWFWKYLPFLYSIIPKNNFKFSVDLKLIK